MATTYELVALVVCLVFSGFFSGSEAVLMSIGIDRAQQLIHEGGPKGRALAFMVERPSELLTTILIGNNVVNIWLASLTSTMAARYFESNAIGISVGVTTFFILIFGEILPKTFARGHAESLSTFVIRVLQFFYIAGYLIVKPVVWLIDVVLGDFAEITGRLVTKKDIEYLVNKAEKEQSMDSKQIELLSSILEFPTIKVRDIMIPRTKTKYLKKDASYAEAIGHVQQDSHSRYPVCDGDLDNTVGFIHVKDLAFLPKEEVEDFQFDRYLKKAFFVYEHMKIQAVFDYMNREKNHMALVKDENGLVIGMVTLEDIIEEILGEIQDEHDEEDDSVVEDIQEMGLSHGIVVLGDIGLRDLNSEFDLGIPLSESYSTLAGFILEMLGNSFPEQGQIIVWEGLSFELTKVEDSQIKELRIKLVDRQKIVQKQADTKESESPAKVELSGAKKLITLALSKFY